MLIPRVLLGPILIAVAAAPPYDNWWWNLLGRPVVLLFGVGFAAESWEPIIKRVRGRWLLRGNPYNYRSPKDRLVDWWLDLRDRLRGN